jgi:hypothetical protein
MTGQPTHHFSQVIVLILQTINIMCKFQILQSVQFMKDQMATREGASE